MEIEMIPAERCERANVELALVQAVQGKSVRRRLQDSILLACFNHLRKPLLDLRRLNRRHVGRVQDRFASAFKRHTAHQANGAARGGEQMRDDVHGGRFAVRASHADDAQLSGGVAEEACRGLRQRSPRVRNRDDGYVRLRDDRLPDLALVLLHEQYVRAAFDSHL